MILTRARQVAANDPQCLESPAALRKLIGELADALEESERERLEQARLLGMSGSREAELLAKLEAAQRDAERYRHIRCGAIMSDGRPFIMGARYRGGAWLGNKMLSGNDADTAIDAARDVSKP